MQFSVECDFSFWSSSVGPVWRICTVKSLTPRTSISGRGRFHSGMMTTVAPPIASRGSWLGERRTPRVTIIRICTPSVIPLAPITSKSRVKGVAREAHVDPEHFRPVPETIEMAVEEGYAAVDRPEVLPDPVAVHKTRIEHGHFRL